MSWPLFCIVCRCAGYFRVGFPPGRSTFRQNFTWLTLRPAVIAGLAVAVHPGPKVKGKEMLSAKRDFLVCMTFAFSLAFCGKPVAHAADWADGLFPVKNHQFGTVAVNSDTKFRFPIVNNTESDIHISNVRASCGCTTPIVETEWVRAGARGSIVARYNTNTFKGKKGATLTVVIDRPYYAEVRLRVDGYIRQDVVFNPGSVDFGTIEQGTLAERVIGIAYAGRSDWKVVDVESDAPHVQAELQPTERTGQRINYNLKVKLTELAPAGPIQQQLLLVTNDRNMPRIPLQVRGKVDTGLSISPAALALGSVKPGEVVEQRLVVRGREPFLIDTIECEGWECTFDAPEKAKSTHLVNIRLQAGGEAGEFRGPLVVTTKGDSQRSAQVLVTAKLLDQ